MNETAVTRVDPHGRTATFLFTDIEGSTRLWAEQRKAMAVALEAHDAILRAAVERSGGRVVKSTGDGILASFDQPEAALTAAIDAQVALDAHDWPLPAPLRVRMAIHSGSAEARDGDFFGPALNRAARLLAIGHGAQVLVSGTTAALAADDLPRASKLIELGEHPLRDLDRPEHVYQLVAPGLRREFPPLRSGSAPATNLPLEVTSFVGRERELAEVARLLTTSRLVTLVGVGGTGKTRLALQAASRRLDHQRDGTWLVELARITAADLVVAEIGRALRVQPPAGQTPLEALVDYLRAKDLLLVLDNCEHLIGAVADVVHSLLGSCPALTVVATSREPLGVDGEALMPVPSLALPAPLDEHDGHSVVDADALDRAASSEAVSLFVQRARATMPTFELDRSNVASAVEICRRLDGIPLAIELAAARVSVLSVAEISQGLGDRFRLLTGGRRTAIPRQRTLQALIDWSWDLLDDEDRRLMRRLSVFAGGWTLESATALNHGSSADNVFDGADRSDPAGRLATLDGLSRLVDRSLVAVDHANATRYRMLETIRQYAADRLAASGEIVALRDRHLAVFLQLALDAERGLEGREMPVWLDRVDAEIDNLRAALDWALESHPETGLEVSVALTRYWQSRTMGPEGRDRLLDAVDRVRRLPEAGSDPAARRRSSLVSRALSGAAVISVMGLGVAAGSLEDEAILTARASGDPATIADALYVTLLSANPLAPGDSRGDSRSAAEEAMRIAMDLGDLGRLGRVQASMAMLQARLDPASADHWLDLASETAQRSGNAQQIASAAQVRGRVASRIGRLADAQRAFREARAAFHAIGDRRFELSAQSELGHVLRRDGQFEEAEVEYRQTIHGWQQSGNRGAVAHQLESFGSVALDRARNERAARLFGAAEALREIARAPMTAVEREEYDTVISRLRGGLDAAAFSSAWSQGRGLTAEEAVALALGD